MRRDEMEYQKAQYAGSSYGTLGAAIGVADVSIGLQQNTAVNAPRTISSAVGRLDVLNERLQGIRHMLENMADQIGGPRPTSGQIRGIGATEAPGNVVSRLNGAADEANNIVSDIEETLKAIGRLLG